MKKNLMMGMVVAMSFQMAFAAPRNAETVRRTVIEEVKRATETTAGKAVDAASAGKTASLLSRIAGASERELQSALQRKIVVKEVEGEKTVSLLELGNKLAAADNAIRTKDLSGLDAAGKAHMETTVEAIKVSSEFLSLANKTSDMGGKLTEQQRLEVAAFNKQVSLIEDMITKMDTADLKTHIEVMKKAIAKRTNPNIAGDQAFAAAIKEGKSQEDYLTRLSELTNCAR